MREIYICFVTTVTRFRETHGKEQKKNKNNSHPLQFCSRMYVSLPLEHW